MAATAEQADSNSASLPPWLGDVDQLLEELRGHHFAIGIGEHSKVLLLLDYLQAEQCQLSSVDQLASWLAPIICSTPAQIQLLTQILHDREAQYAIDHPPQPDPPAPAPPPKSGSAFSLRSLATFLFYIAIAGFTAYSIWTGRNQDPVADAPVQVEQRTEANTTQFDFTLPEMNSSYAIQVALAIACLGFAFGYIRHLRRKLLKLARKVSNQSLAETPVAYHLDFAPLYTANELSHPLQVLRKHIEVNSRRLDVDKTIAATLRAGGRVVLKEGTRPQLPEYLLLTHRSSSHDHRSALAENLMQRLQREQLHVTRMEYSVDPRRCRDRNGHVVNLADMQGGLAHQRLLIIDDAEQFFVRGSFHPQPWLNLLLRWQWVTLLTPKPKSAWGKRESLLADMGIHLHNASPAGVNELALQLQQESAPVLAAAASTSPLWQLLAHEPHRWIQSRAPQAADINALLESLQQDLSPAAYELLCSVAVMPLLTPNLTLYLAHQLRELDSSTGPQPSLEEVFGELSRLPWLQCGSMPEWLRVRLVRSIPYQLEGRVRAICRTLVADNLDKDDANLVLRLARDESSSWKQILERIYQRDSDNEWHDYIFLSYLGGNKDLDLEVARESRLGQSVLPSFSRQEVMVLLAGLVPALFLLLSNSLLDNNPLDDLIKSGLSVVDELLLETFANGSLLLKSLAGSVLLMIASWLLAFHFPAALPRALVKVTIPLCLLLLSAEWYLVIAVPGKGLGVAEHPDFLGLLSFSVCTAVLILLQPWRTDLKPGSVYLVFLPRRWIGFFLAGFVSLMLLFSAPIWVAADVWSGWDTWLLGQALWLLFAVPTLYTYAFHGTTQKKAVAARWWAALTTPLLLLACTNLLNVASLGLLEENYPYLQPVTLIVTTLTTSQYLHRYLNTSAQQQWLRAAARIFLPWLLVAGVGVTFLTDGLFGDIIIADLGLGIGIYLWLAAWFAIAGFPRANSVAPEVRRSFMLFGGLLIILSNGFSVLGRIVADNVIGIDVFTSVDFWSVALLLPLIRMNFPALFLKAERTTKSDPVTSIRNEKLTLWPALPLSLIPLLPLGIAVIGDHYYELYSRDYSYCLLPFAAWAALRYGRQAHWLLLPGYLGLALLSLSLIGLTFSDFIDEIQLNLSSFLFPASLLIYLIERFSKDQSLLECNRISPFQWLFLLIVIGFSGEIGGVGWYGDLFVLIFALLISVSNCSFRTPLLLVLAITLFSELAYLVWWQHSSPAVWIYPSYHAEFILFTCALLGFRWFWNRAQTIQPKNYLALFCLLLPLHIFNPYLELTDSFGISLYAAYLLPVLSFLYGLFLPLTARAFLTPVWIITVSGLLVFLSIGRLNGELDLGTPLYYFGDPITTLIATFCYGWFFKLGQRCTHLRELKARQVERQQQEQLNKLQTSSVEVNETFPADAGHISLVAGISDLGSSERPFPLFTRSPLTVSLLILALLIWGGAQINSFTADNSSNPTIPTAQPQNNNSPVEAIPQQQPQQQQQEPQQPQQQQLPQQQEPEQQQEQLPRDSYQQQSTPEQGQARKKADISQRSEEASPPINQETAPSEDSEKVPMPPKLL
ncbi:MAG: hypothetical protein GYB33_06685 [Gammaproteobacteria bacterium]|nr:hypothetical protein [Gammaproteobacteria bacterium]